MSRVVGIIILLTVSGHLFAQDFKDLMNKSDRLYAKGDFNSALDLYRKAEVLQPSNPTVQLKIGLTYLSTTSFKHKALPYLQKAFNAQPNIDPLIDYYLGAAYQVTHEFAKAREHYELFKKKNRRMAEIAQHKIEECNRGDSLVTNATEAIIENVGKTINSTHHDYAPLLYPNGDAMIFTSNREVPLAPDQPKPSVNFEDIYLAIRYNERWELPEHLSPEVNVEQHDAAASISHDGKYLFLYYEDGYGDIYMSELEDGKWGKPVALNMNINTLNWETSASMSADGRKLYFSSNRPGGYGELDIWMSAKDGKGEWGKPINLGPNVNTPGNEDSPFIHHDGVTLYFGSDAHPGLGNTDIFRSDFREGKWQKPVNMGYPVNSADYDNYFVISKNKKDGYFASVREDGLGETDIYFIHFLDPKPKEIVVVAPVVIEQPVVEKEKDFVDPIVQLQKDLKIGTILKGKVIDANTAEPLAARMILTDNEKNVVLAVINSDPKTGDFEMFIPHGGNYGVSTEKEGYLFNSINFNLPAFSEMQEIDTHIIMEKAEVGSKVVLKNIFFDTGKADLKQESVAELETMRKLLEKNTGLKVQINGHTDNVGEATYNKGLSLKRARSVVDYLIRNGIDVNRLAAIGYGEERPLVSNDDETGGREINRRTEIEIIGAGEGQ
jgi:outer membrane protein OmpA-like peptidoglycan-associated protein/tetratricopeptide (TPR) repeat protein